MGDPEGNLVIAERVEHECQRRFSDWEYGWVGTAHVLTSTLYGWTDSPWHFEFLKVNATTIVAFTLAQDTARLLEK